jgi:hypothetical protein
VTTDWPEFDDVIDPAEVPVPGSRPRVKHEKRAPEKQAAQPWDAHPKVYRVDGKDTELFGSHALCLAIGLNNEQLKHWERRGWIPKTNVRFPRNTKGRQDLSPMLLNGGGGAIPGRRLYTRGFIEGLVALVNEFDLLAVPGTTPAGTDFPQRALDLYHQTMPGEPAP